MGFLLSSHFYHDRIQIRDDWYWNGDEMCLEYSVNLNQKKKQDELQSQRIFLAVKCLALERIPKSKDNKLQSKSVLKVGSWGSRNKVSLLKSHKVTKLLLPMRIKYLIIRPDDNKMTFCQHSTHW